MDISVCFLQAGVVYICKIKTFLAKTASASGRNDWI